jgi:molecular chaperone Hsp33
MRNSLIPLGVFVNRVHRFYSDDLFIRATSVVSTSVMRELCSVQKTGPLATMALGRAVTGALLMAAQMRDHQVVGLHFRGNGPLGSVYAEASYEGECRGWCDAPDASVPLKNGRIDVAAGLGIGVLNVIRSQPFEKAPHVGTVEMVSSEIGDDIAYYLHQSQQISSVTALGVVLDETGLIKSCGGVLIELMPGATEAVVARLEQFVQKAKPLSQLLSDNESAPALLKNYTGEIVMNQTEHPFELKYTCRCNMDRVERSISMLGRDELTRMVSEGRDTSVRCEFCGRSYVIDLRRLQQLLSDFSTIN